jgi:hypothetical protein
MDFLAALFGALGFVGRPRRRAGIVADLDLLGQLRDSHAFGPDSQAHRHLVQHISLEVAKLANVELKRRKTVPWASVAFAAVIGAPLGFWTYELNRQGFDWLSILPGAVAALMLLAILGMLLDREEAPDDRPNEHKEVHLGADTR